MVRIMPKPSTRFLGLCAVSCLVAAAPYVHAQAPAAPVNPLEKLYVDAETAFTAADYATATTKLEALIKEVVAKEPTNPVLERVRFSLGLAYLLKAEAEAKPESADWGKAEAAFNACLAAFPKGEFATR